MRPAWRSFCWLRGADRNMFVLRGTDRRREALLPVSSSAGQCALLRRRLARDVKRTYRHHLQPCQLRHQWHQLQQPSILLQQSVYSLDLLSEDLGRPLCSSCLDLELGHHHQLARKQCSSSCSDQEAYCETARLSHHHWWTRPVTMDWPLLMLILMDGPRSAPQE